MVTNFDWHEAGLKKKWFAILPSAFALALLGLCMVEPVVADAGQLLTPKEVRSYRHNYAALYNEMLDILESPRFYEAGFGKNYPKAHAWATKVTRMTNQYGGQSIIKATYNALSDSALMPGDLWQIANEVLNRRALSSAIKKLLGQIEYNILMGDSMNVVEERLPGIDRYRNYMRYQGFYWTDGYEQSNLPGPVSVKWLQLNVPKDDTYIPARYHANGQTLLVGVVADGSALILKKKPTKEVFLDRIVEGDDQDMVVSLH